MKPMHDKSPVKTTFNSEKLRALLEDKERQRCPLFLLLFHIVLEVLAMEIRKEKEIKVIQIGKEEIKSSLFADNDTIHRKS